MNQYERSLLDKYLEYRRCLDCRENMRFHVGKRMTLNGLLAHTGVTMFNDWVIRLEKVSRFGEDRLLTEHLWIIVPDNLWHYVSKLPLWEDIRLNGEITEYREGKYGVKNVSYITADPSIAHAEERCSSAYSYPVSPESNSWHMQTGENPDQIYS